MRTLKRYIRSGIVGILRDEARTILANRYIAGKLLPLDPAGDYHVVPRSQRSSAELPVPPEDMWEGYGSTPEEYLTSGKRHIQSMVDVLAKAGVNASDLRFVLDFGCAGARLLRFFPRTDAAGFEYWGVDINAEYINWCQQHLSPPFLFATTTTFPHLPFEDNTFDLVYCGSVFTHVTDLADAWFLELRRVLRKGGYAYITIQDSSSMETLLSRIRERPGGDGLPAQSWVKVDGDPGTSPALLEAIRGAERAVGVSRMKDHAMLTFSTDPYSNIFYDTQYLVDKWSRYADVVSVTPAAYGCQTAFLCRKR